MEPFLKYLPPAVVTAIVIFVAFHFIIKSGHEIVGIFLGRGSPAKLIEQIGNSIDTEIKLRENGHDDTADLVKINIDQKLAPRLAKSMMRPSSASGNGIYIWIILIWILLWVCGFFAFVWKWATEWADQFVEEVRTIYGWEVSEWGEWAILMGGYAVAYLYLQWVLSHTQRALKQYVKEMQAGADDSQ